jgi:hypothetical protein
VHSDAGTPFATAKGMGRTLPPVDVPPGELPTRPRIGRLPVVRSLVGHALPMHLPVLLQDISAGGFSAVAIISLTPGDTYYLQFALHPQTIVLRARLTQATRISGDQDPGYLLSFDFADTEWDKPAIETLIAEATIAAP